MLSHTLESGVFMRRAEVSVDEGADGGVSCSCCAVKGLSLHQLRGSAYKVLCISQAEFQ